MTNEVPFCADQSSKFRAPLFGTAPRIEAWILLEYPYPFSTKAIDENDLPREVMDRLSLAQESIPNSRILLIKKRNNPAQSGYQMHLVRSTPDHQVMYRYRLETYSDLISLDLESILLGEVDPQDNITTDPLFLICTNGKRDRCCAKYGLPLFETMQSNAGPDDLSPDVSDHDVWQSSHVGGHRFAANVICLPHGIYYGRMTAETAGRVFDKYHQGQIVPAHYRGRTSYEPVEQAGEYYLRDNTGNTAIDDLKLVETTQREENSWQVRFMSTTGEEYTLKIHTGLSEFKIFESCVSSEKLVQQIIFHRDEISGV